MNEKSRQTCVNRKTHTVLLRVSGSCNDMTTQIMNQLFWGQLSLSDMKDLRNGPKSINRCIEMFCFSVWWLWISFSLVRARFCLVSLSYSPSNYRFLRWWSFREPIEHYKALKIRIRFYINERNTISSLTRESHNFFGWLYRLKRQMHWKSSH